jgi:hypothetical protein
MISKVEPNIAIDPRCDFLSLQGVKVIFPLLPIIVAMGSAKVITKIDNINDIGFSQKNIKRINIDKGK